MKLTTHRVLEQRQLREPSFQITRAHAGIATLLLVPIDSVCRIIGRKLRVDAPHGHEVHTTPDASIDIVIVSNEAFDGIFVGGPLRTFTKRALRGETRLAGLSLRPGFGALLGVSAEALPADWIPLAALELSGVKAAPEEGLAGLFRFIEARAEAARFDARLAETIARLEQQPPRLERRVARAPNTFE